MSPRTSDSPIAEREWPTELLNHILSYVRLAIRPGLKRRTWASVHAQVRMTEGVRVECLDYALSKSQRARAEEEEEEGSEDSDDSDESAYFAARGISRATDREILWCVQCGEELTKPEDPDYWDPHQPELSAKHCVPCDLYGPSYEY